MSASFLFFLERLGLADVYFNDTAEALILTRSEYGSLERMASAGFFAADRIKSFIDRGWIREAPKVAAKGGGEIGVHPSIKNSLAVYKEVDAKVLITEDPVLRARASRAGMRVVSTPDVIFNMAKRNIIDEKTALEAMGGLQLLGWHSEALIERIKETIRCLFAGRK